MPCLVGFDGLEVRRTTSCLTPYDGLLVRRCLKARTLFLFRHVAEWQALRIGIDSSYPAFGCPSAIAAADGNLNVLVGDIRLDTQFFRLDIQADGDR